MGSMRNSIQRRQWQSSKDKALDLDKAILTNLQGPRNNSTLLTRSNEHQYHGLTRLSFLSGNNNRGKTNGHREFYSSVLWCWYPVTEAEEGLLPLPGNTLELPSRLYSLRVFTPFASFSLENLWPVFLQLQHGAFWGDLKMSPDQTWACDSLISTSQPLGRAATTPRR